MLIIIILFISKLSLHCPMLLMRNLMQHYLSINDHQFHLHIEKLYMASFNSRQLCLLLFFLLATASSSSAINNNNNNVIQKGFYATPDTSSSIKFQPVLTDPTSAFSFGFLRLNSSLLDLAILHLPSSFPLWRALPSPPFPWSPSTSLSFDGSSLLLSDPTKRSLLWSATITHTKAIEDDYSLILLNSSNLQIIGKAHQRVLWQSFDFPSDTIVEHQNLTSKSTLFSTNRRFSMRLGPTYLALYIQNLGMYWKRTAQQAKAQIDSAQGPIYARLDPTGFLGLYQNETAIVDVVSFDTFNSGIKRALRRLTLEPDGNLKAYYWSGSNWVSDFAAISQTCDLPAACGPYGLCHVDGQTCGGCVDGEGCSFTAGSGDFCGSDPNGFRVLRKAGVDLANKELLGFVQVGSLQKCEGLCANNCSCWGVLYNNVSGYCYTIEYPIQTVLAVGDERKFGYFKARNLAGGDEGRKISELVLIIVGVLVFVTGCGFTGYRVWNARRWRRNDDDEVGMMPYKDLKSSSFRWIEMSSDSFRK